MVLVELGRAGAAGRMLSLVRKDLIFPRDLFYDSPSLFVKIRDSKTARFARRQHGRIDDPGIIAVTEAIFGSLSLEARLYPASIASFRKSYAGSPAWLRRDLSLCFYHWLGGLEGSLEPSAHFGVLLAGGWRFHVDPWGASLPKLVSRIWLNLHGQCSGH